jgi:hypothetical protein
MGSVTAAKVIALVLTLGFSLNEMARSRRFTRDPQRGRRQTKSLSARLPG